MTSNCLDDISLPHAHLATPSLRPALTQACCVDRFPSSRTLRLRSVSADVSPVHYNAFTLAPAAVSADVDGMQRGKDCAPAEPADVDGMPQRAPTEPAAIARSPQRAPAEPAAIARSPQRSSPSGALRGSQRHSVARSLQRSVEPAKERRSRDKRTIDEMTQEAHVAVTALSAKERRSGGKRALPLDQAVPLASSRASKRPRRS